MIRKGVASLIVTFDDGSQEEWTFPPGTAFFKSSPNYKTVAGSHQILEQWKEQIIQWTSDRHKRPG